MELLILLFLIKLLTRHLVTGVMLPFSINFLYISCFYIFLIFRESTWIFIHFSYLPKFIFCVWIWYWLTWLVLKTVDFISKACFVFRYVLCFKMYHILGCSYVFSRNIRNFLEFNLLIPSTWRSVTKYYSSYILLWCQLTKHFGRYRKYSNLVWNKKKIILTAIHSLKESKRDRTGLEFCSMFCTQPSFYCLRMWLVCGCLLHEC